MHDSLDGDAPGSEEHHIGWFGSFWMACESDLTTAAGAGENDTSSGVRFRAIAVTPWMGSVASVVRDASIP